MEEDVDVDSGVAAWFVLALFDVFMIRFPFFAHFVFFASFAVFLFLYFDMNNTKNTMSASLFSCVPYLATEFTKK